MDTWTIVSYLGTAIGGAALGLVYMGLTSGATYDKGRSDGCHAGYMDADDAGEAQLQRCRSVWVRRIEVHREHQRNLRASLEQQQTGQSLLDAIAAADEQLRKAGVERPNGNGVAT